MTFCEGIRLERLRGAEASGFEGHERFREVVARVVDLGAHGVADEVVPRVGDDLLDGWPGCVRVQPGIKVFGLEDMMLTRRITD